MEGYLLGYMSISMKLSSTVTQSIQMNRYALCTKKKYFMVINPWNGNVVGSVLAIIEFYDASTKW